MVSLYSNWRTVITLFLIDETPAYKDSLIRPPD